MSNDTNTQTAAERYDTSRRHARDNRLPPDYPVPQPTTAWPAENVVLLELFREWLLSSGTSRYTVDHLYVPMAGNALGLNLKPHPQLDMDADLEQALDYVKAKRLSAEWIDMCRNALEKFRLFLRQQRGHPHVVVKPLNRERYCTGLPDWLVQQLERLQHLRQPNWRPARINEQTMRFWSGHTRLWRWLFEHYSITDLADIKRQHVFDYVDHRLAAGYAPKSINQDLRYFHAFLLHLQDQDYQTPQALLRIPGLKEPDRLPRFLTDEQVRLLRDDLEQRVEQAHTAARRRNTLFDRAAFYLLWHGGLRLGEVEDLFLEDLDLPGRRLTVQQGKGRKDRTVYLTDTAVQAVEEYLTVRGMGPTDHVFLYHNQPVCKDLIRDRIKAAGKRVGVKVSPHCLRHTYATQLINAGCRVTSIQKLLGHRRLNSTMLYARVHNRTVADDYYTAMAEIERSLTPSAGSGLAPTAGTYDGDESVSASERASLLELLSRLAEPQLDHETRLDLVARMRCVLDGGPPEQIKIPINSTGATAQAILASTAPPW